jgi:hypothetical protein
MDIHEARERVQDVFGSSLMGASIRSPVALAAGRGLSLPGAAGQPWTRPEISSQAVTAKAENEVRAVRKTQLMLPNPEYSPTASAKLPVDFPVSGLVALDFGVPIVLIRCRAPIALEAAMPEATIDKDAELAGAEYEVRLARQILVATPASDAKLSKDRDQP